MKLLFAAASAAALLAAGSASAQTLGSGQFYGTLGYSQISTDLEGDFNGDGRDDTFDIDIGAITGRFGARFTPYLGAEAEVSFGVRDSEDSQRFSVGGTTVTADVAVKLKNEVAAYGVGFLPVAPNADVFARIGYGRSSLETEVSASGGGSTFRESDEGENNFLAYGGGAQYFFDGLNGVRAEYTYFDITEEDAGGFDSFSISYVRKF